MNRSQLISFLFLLVTSCTPERDGGKSENRIPTAGRQTRSLRQDGTRLDPIFKGQLYGAWTDGSTENASFFIEKDSIFYMDQMTSYPYSLKGDSLTIVYPDMIFQGIAGFSGDTLILRDSEFGTSKYTRFKD
jgi:hypothetical protein